MIHSYKNQKCKSLTTGIFALLLTTGMGHAGQPATDAPLEDDLLNLYFDQEQLVETPTRSPMPLSQVAENITVVTAQEIEAMRAHTLAEVLNRQSGVFVNFKGQDFLGDSSVFLQGSKRYHVLFLLDGVRLNLNSNGFAVTDFIPLGIIKRIEIIKGAASSTWGSALGGVINIITKDTGKTSRPNGHVTASYAEADSYEIAADAAGKAKALSYYLYGGTINSDGLKLDRYGERDAVYGKLQLQLPGTSQLTVTGGYSDPAYKNLNWQDAWDISGLNIAEEIDQRNIWATIFFDTELSRNFTLHLSAQHFDNTFQALKNSLGTGIGGMQGELVFGEEWDDESTNFTGRLTWAGEMLTANFGVEANRSEMSYDKQMGVFFGGPETTADEPISEDRHGVYGNFTYVNGNFTITPGLRYDYHSNSEESVNPSLGATYRVAPDTILRGLIAKGFSAPYLGASAHSPDLEPENIWTTQAGIETARIPMLHLQGTIFYHDIDDAWELVVPWINTGSQSLTGFEVEARTVDFHGFRLTGNFTYVNYDIEETSDNSLTDDETYTGNLILSYLNTAYGIRAELAGHYYWMNEQERNEAPADGTFLWDLLLAKDFTLPHISGEVYLKAHNLFNGSQYFDFEYPNPDRWVEVGLAFRY